MKMKRICGALLLLFILPLFSACGEKEDAFPGASLVNYPITTEALKVNVKDKPKMYVMTNVSMDVSDEKMVAVFTERNYRIIQIINEYFRKLDLETLQTADIQTTAGEALVKELNQEFNTDVIQTVYLPDFLIYP